MITAQQIENHMDLARSIAWKTKERNPWIDNSEMDDLFGISFLGLVEASKSYRPDKGSTFTVWSFIIIRRKLSGYIEKRMTLREQRDSTCLRLGGLKDKSDALAYDDVELEHVEDVDEVRCFLDSLDDRDLAILECSMNDMTQEETAVVLSAKFNEYWDQGKVSMRKAKIRQFLKEYREEK